MTEGKVKWQGKVEIHMTSHGLLVRRGSLDVNVIETLAMETKNFCGSRIPYGEVLFGVVI